MRFPRNQREDLAGVEAGLGHHDLPAGQEVGEQAREPADVEHRRGRQADDLHGVIVEPMRQPASALHDVMLVVVTERRDSSTAFGIPELPEVNSISAAASPSVTIAGEIAPSLASNAARRSPSDCAESRRRGARR